MCSFTLETTYRDPTQALDQREEDEPEVKIINKDDDFTLIANTAFKKISGSKVDIFDKPIFKRESSEHN